jgi:hypothetical protein
MNKADEERVKLTANFLNSTATAFMTAAVIAPVVGGTTGLLRLSDSDFWYVAGGCSFWALIAVLLHLVARNHLRRLE